MRVHISNIKYKVDKKNKTVICTGEYDTTDLAKYLSNEDSRLIYRIADIPLIRCKGVAICSDNDDFDEETGKLIARIKMRKKCYKEIQKYNNKIIELCDNLFHKLFNINNELHYRWLKHNNIEKLYKK